MADGSAGQTVEEEQDAILAALRILCDKEPTPAETAEVLLELERHYVGRDSLAHHIGGAI